MNICLIDNCEKHAKKGGKGWCHGHWHRWQRYGDPIGQPAPRARKAKEKCNIINCPNHAVVHKICQAHYVRQKKYGHPQANIPLRNGTFPTTRYRKITLKNHPISTKEGRILEHRFLLYEAIGPGQHLCNWCSKMVYWDISAPHPDALVVDHLNWDRTDNQLSNLVVSCGKCNSHRWRE